MKSSNWQDDVSFWISGVFPLGTCQDIFNSRCAAVCGGIKTLMHRLYSGNLWEAITFIECIVIAFPCHLLHSLGGSLPLVCHLEPSVQSVLSFIQALPHITLSAPSSSVSFLLYFSSLRGTGEAI